MAKKNWLDAYAGFCQIARELREFEAYEMIDDLRYRMLHFNAKDTTTETTEPDMDVYRKCFRITFIGEASAPEKRKFIKAAFPEATPFQVENSSEDASDIESYYYYEKEKNCRFAIINTPSLSESEQGDVNKIPDVGELHTEAIVFVISGDAINESEKSCLEKIKYQVDNNFLFFLHAAENFTPYHHINNIDTITAILKDYKEEEILYFSLNESSSIGQHFADKPEQCFSLLFRKIRSYMIQYYQRFEINVEAYLRSVTELSNFNKDIDTLEVKTFKEIDWFSIQFRRKLDQEFPIEASYSSDIREKIKALTHNLSEKDGSKSQKGLNIFTQNRLKQKLNEAAKKFDKDLKELTEVWTEKLEDIIGEYLRAISHEMRKGLRESGHTYRSPIPLNRKIELKVIRNFHVSIFQTDNMASIARVLPSAFLPAYFIGSATASAAAEAAKAAAAKGIAVAGIGAFANPIGVIVGVIVAAVIIGALLWCSSKDRTNQSYTATAIIISEVEKDIKPFNYYVAHTIRMEFEEIIHFSQDALRNVFKEIRKAERKRITINNACPAIKAITEDSLLEKIRRSRQAIESTEIK